MIGWGSSELGSHRRQIYVEGFHEQCSTRPIAGSSERSYSRYLHESWWVWCVEYVYGSGRVRHILMKLEREKVKSDESGLKYWPQKGTTTDQLLSKFLTRSHLHPTRSSTPSSNSVQIYSRCKNTNLEVGTSWVFFFFFFDRFLILTSYSYMNESLQPFESPFKIPQQRYFMSIYPLASVASSIPTSFTGKSSSRVSTNRSLSSALHCYWSPKGSFFNLVNLIFRDLSPISASQKTQR